jgi:hypothetical protein
VIAYLVRLPFRMAKEAVAVPLRDLDARLCVSAAHRFITAYPLTLPTCEHEWFANCPDGCDAA